MIRLLVTGSRTWDDADYIRAVLDKLLAEHESISLYHGACPFGADAIADGWALDAIDGGAAVAIHRFPAQWLRLGRRAGMIRNRDMVAIVAPLRESAACHAFIRDDSRGASHCAKHARRAGIPVTIHRYEDVTGGAR